MPDVELTVDGDRLVTSWLAARKELVQAMERLSRARSALEAAEKELAQWLKPDDAQPGEKIAVWFQDALIQVVVGNKAPPSPDVVTLRKRGREFMKAHPNA